MNEIDLTTAVARAAAGATAEEMLMLRDKIDASMTRLRELRDHLDSEHLIPAVMDRGTVTIGTVRYWVGMDKETKCVDLAGTVTALLEASGGDVAQLAGCLSVNAFKHGAAGKLLPPEVYRRLFVTTEKAVLRDGSAARPRLQSVDSRFVEARAEAVK